MSCALRNAAKPSGIRRFQQLITPKEALSDGENRLMGWRMRRKPSLGMRKSTLQTARTIGRRPRIAWTINRAQPRPRHKLRKHNCAVMTRIVEMLKHRSSHKDLVAASVEVEANEAVVESQRPTNLETATKATGVNPSRQCE